MRLVLLLGLLGAPALGSQAGPSLDAALYRVDEAWKTGSLAGEVSAQIMERGLDSLDWPVQRVCSAEVPVPYAKHLEDAALPNVERIVAAVKGML